MICKNCAGKVTRTIPKEILLLILREGIKPEYDFYCENCGKIPEKDVILDPEDYSDQPEIAKMRIDPEDREDEK